MLLAFLTNTTLANTLPVYELTQHNLKNMFKHKATATLFHYIFGCSHLNFEKQGRKKHCSAAFVFFIVLVLKINRIINVSPNFQFLLLFFFLLSLHYKNIYLTYKFYTNYYSFFPYLFLKAF